MSGPVQPLRQFILKVHSRCDLACDHCYVYEHLDQSWRTRPTVMSAETVAWTAQRIAEHAKAHGLPEVRVILHGGEPLLAGPGRLKQTAQALHGALSGVCGLDLRIHTNAVQLDDTFLGMFVEQNIKVGVSADGDQLAHDRHRRFADGRGSYQKVTKAIDLLRSQKYRHLYAGLLCTIDVANDPVAVYESLLALDPPRIDFLLPHATWDHPPHQPPGAQTAYADWLMVIFDRWAAGRRPVRIRLFDSIISTSLGGDSLTEALGLAPADLVVVETDGTYEQADSLKTAFDGAPFTGLDIFQHDLDQVAGHPAISARQQGLAGLCRTCQACPVVTSCGGGLYAHRYRTATGFANPSVYCADLLKLITDVRHRLWPPAAPHAARPVHTVPGPELDALAGGFGDEVAMGHLISAQRSLRRALVAAVYEAATASDAGLAATADVSLAWDLLSRADRADTAAVDAVLGHPFVRVWAVQCLERLGGAGYADGKPAGPPLGTVLGHLAAIAVTAAIRAGMSAQATVPVRDGAIHLPSLGRFITGGAGPAETAAIEVSPDRFAVLAGGSRWTATRTTPATGGMGFSTTDGARWQPLRPLTAPGLSVGLEDADPYRDCYGWPPTSRLSGADAALWQQQFGKAWALIQKDHAAYAPGLAAGLATIMPMSAAPEGRDTSATARHAFGAVGAALPADYPTLALLLIHEFQHVKLGAVLDLYDLYDQADDRRFQVRWREDPRPLEGVLQGTYAHVAVTDFWRIRRQTTTGAVAEAADKHFAHWRAGTADAIETLAGSGSLTPLGERFVERMRSSVTPWLDEPVRTRAIHTA